MTIRSQYVEKGVVHAQWIDRVTIDELEVAVRKTRQQIDEEGDAVFVLIIDLRECKAIPFDLRGLRRVGILDPRIAGYVVLKPSEVAKAMMNMLSQVAGLSFRMTSSLDEALAIARSMLDERLTTKP